MTSYSSYLLKDVPQCSIGEVTEGIQVVAHGATEEHWILGDDGHLPPEVMQPNLLCVYPIDGDGSKGLSHPVEHRQQGGLPGTCSTHNANLEMLKWRCGESGLSRGVSYSGGRLSHELYLLCGFDLKAERLEHEREVRRVTE